MVGGVKGGGVGKAGALWQSNSRAAVHGEPDISFGGWKHLAHRCQIEARQQKSQIQKSGIHDDVRFLKKKSYIPSAMHFHVVFHNFICCFP